MPMPESELTLVVDADIDDADTHPEWCICENCRPDYRHDRLEVA